MSSGCRHNSAWTLGQAFSQPRDIVAVSPLGRISTPAGAHIEGDSALRDAAEIRDIENPWLTQSVYMPERGQFSLEQTSGLAWSPDGRFLVIAINNVGGEPYLLAYWDIHRRQYRRLLIGNLSGTSDLACSQSGTYIAVSSRLSKDPPLYLWRAQNGVFHFVEPIFRFDRHSHHLLGIRSLAFSASEQLLFAVGEVGASAPNVLAHWDELLLLTLPDLRIQHSIKAPEQVFALSWRANQNDVVLCGSYGRMFTLNIKTGEAVRLPLQGALCRCHPCDDDLCAFLAGDNITIARLSDGAIVSERVVAEQDIGTLDMRWSLDGNKLYVASGTGRTYVYAL